MNVAGCCWLSCLSQEAFNHCRGRGASQSTNGGKQCRKTWWNHNIYVYLISLFEECYSLSSSNHKSDVSICCPSRAADVQVTKHALWSKWKKNASQLIFHLSRKNPPSCQSLPSFSYVFDLISHQFFSRTEYFHLFPAFDLELEMSKRCRKLAVWARDDHVCHNRCNEDKLWVLHCVVLKHYYESGTD